MKKKNTTGQNPSISINSLREFPFLAALSDKNLRALLKVIKVQQVRPHEIIIREDMNQQHPPLYLILRGECQVLKMGLVISTLKEGDHFGEMGLLTHRPRSSTIKAVHPCTLLVIEESVFNRYLRPQGAVMNSIIMTLDQRLRHTTEGLVKRFFDPKELALTNQTLILREMALDVIDQLQAKLNLYPETRTLLKDFTTFLNQAGAGEEKIPFSLHDLIHQTCRLLDNYLVAERITVSLVLSATHDQVIGHYEKMQQILINILVAAKKSIATLPARERKKGLEGNSNQITISTLTRGKGKKKTIVLSVTDRGSKNPLLKEKNIDVWPIRAVVKAHKGKLNIDRQNKENKTEIELKLK